MKLFTDIPNISRLFDVFPGSETDYRGKIVRKPRIVAKIYSNGTKYQHLEEKELPICINRDGYCTVSFSIDKVQYYFMLHRIIEEIYIPCDNMQVLEVNHKDGDKQNNRIDNLEWVTHKDNQVHASQSGLMDTIQIVHIESNKYYGSISSCEKDLGLREGCLYEIYKSRPSFEYHGQHFKVLNPVLEVKRLNNIRNSIGSRRCYVHDVIDEDTKIIYPSMTACDKHLNVYIGRTQHSILSGIPVKPGHTCKLMIPNDIYQLRQNHYDRYKLKCIVY